MNNIWSAELGEEGGNDVCQKHDAFRYVRADEIKGGGEDDNVEHIVD